MAAAQLTTDYKGADYTASLTIGNPNIINESGVLVGHYLQSVTKQLALGGELAYQYGPAVPGGQMAVMSAAARYAINLLVDAVCTSFLFLFINFTRQVR